MQLRPSFVPPSKVASALENRFEALREFLACTQEEVAVAITRDPSGAVAEMFLHLVQVPPVGDEFGGAGVPDVADRQALRDGGALAG